MPYPCGRRLWQLAGGTVVAAAMAMAILARITSGLIRQSNPESRSTNAYATKVVCTLHLPGLPAAPVKIQALYEGGREVLEILSDSETEPEPDLDDSDIEEVSGELTRQASRSSSIIPPPDVDTVEDKMCSSSDSVLSADIAYTNSSESPLAETFFDTAFNFYSTSSFASPLPSLPPPPAESPCGSSPAPENLTPDMPPSHLTRARRSRLDGLEPTNILAPGSSRSRAPSSRKRDAEENISEQPKKKRRAGKLQKFAAAEA
ncbi:hypothetical protein B0H10DRAFT_1961405 [Mycena sp. CBHHK59/15]|nr:hypothetical protein B0H10DRAFT_1961405 [Mycena sp. CBHHK59/15]